MKQEYPKHLYHPEHGSKQVDTPEEHEALGDEWKESPEFEDAAAAQKAKDEAEAEKAAKAAAAQKAKDEAEAEKAAKAAAAQKAKDEAKAAKDAAKAAKAAGK